MSPIGVNSTLDGSHNTTQGWIPSPDGRGTLDIVWSCFFTVFLCCWTSICVNVPALTDRARERFRDKLEVACLGLLGPEFLFVLALGQWLSARRSMRAFHKMGCEYWTMSHAFFADMGGFLLHTPGWPAFPLDARQLHYLVKKGYMECPKLDKRTIDDVNKADGLARFVTVCQVVWFTVNSIARLVQHLELTKMELTTLGFVYCTLGTSYVWRHKPSDVINPVVLRIDVTIADILTQAGHPARHPYRRTPLDFVSREEWEVSLFWHCYTNILRSFGLRLFARPITARPYDRIPSINWPAIPYPVVLSAAILSTTYFGIFMCAWNFSSPTRTEQVLWRMASLYSFVLPILAIPTFYPLYRSTLSFKVDAALPEDGDGYDYDSVTQKITGWLTNRCAWLLPTTANSLEHDREGSANKDAHYNENAYKKRIRRVVEKLENNSPDKDPALRIPLQALVPFSIGCALYVFARLFTLVEDLLQLRAMPLSAYQTVEWSQWFPHL